MKSPLTRITLLSCILWSGLWQTTGWAADVIGFNRDIRPILSRYCLPCHGPDAAAREGHLRLDKFDDATRIDDQGRAAIIAGNPAASQMIQRMESTDPEDRMPPPETEMLPSDGEKALLRAWIEQGAPYQTHWAFIAPSEKPLPAVADASWVRNPIDTLVLSSLEARELTPAPEASLATLFRRASLTLTGLPPDPSTMRRFMEDPSDEAYEKWVDYLIQSDRYGEHRARYWLDAARYGDTHGLHLDNERAIWPYRDWVISAMNENKPFDTFTIEQIAGDLLPDASIPQQVATGFNRCNVSTGEGGAIPEEFAVRYGVDRINTLGAVWMGLTVGCSQCHDHKFDPITQKEYYQLFAFYNQLDENPMDSNALRYPPTLELRTPEHQRQIDLLDQQIQLIQTATRSALEAMDLSEENSEPAHPQARDYIWLQDALPKGANASKEANAWSFVSGAGYPIKGGNQSHRGKYAGSGQHFFTEALPGLRVGSEDTLFTHVYLDPEDPPRSLMLQFQAENWNHRAYWGEDLIEHGKGGKEAGYHHMGSLPPTGQWVRLEVSASEVGLEPGSRIHGWAFTQYDGTVFWDESGIHSAWPQEADGFASYTHWLHAMESALGKGLPEPLGDIVKKQAPERSAEEALLLKEHYLQFENEPTRSFFKTLRDQQDQVAKQKKDLIASIPHSMVTREKAEPRETFILNRGEYDKPSEKVLPAVPEILPQLEENAPRNRLGLAQWLVSGEHPLTARVVINRIWQEHFGSGLVSTPEDFGTQGALPSHPELLDWLALEWVRSGWDMKHMHRLIVTSATFRQSSRFAQSSLQIDPTNQWLSRGPRYRLDAEVIRDTALWASGLLIEQVGGRGVKPYQPPGLWKAVAYPSSSTANFVQDHGSALYRRSLYTFFKRTSPPPGMTLLDAPNRESCTVRRERTNTPLQALHLLNDTQYMEAARCFAEWVMEQTHGELPARLTLAMERVVARAPDSTELGWLINQWQEHQSYFSSHQDQAQELCDVGEAPRLSVESSAELAAWIMIANLLLNLDETLNLN